MSGEELIGNKVRLTEAYKQFVAIEAERQRKCGLDIENWAEEFANSVGIVESLVDYGDTKGPEVDVRWQPSGLRYGYHPDHLEIAED